MRFAIATFAVALFAVLFAVTAGSVASATTHSGGIESLEAPWGLAVAAKGTLYVVDVAHDQVLKQVSGGQFQVVAGSGEQGFSGDGGPATKAKLRLLWMSGIAVSRAGTLYIADTGNDRVRAINPDGVITTVAGDGRGGMVLATTPALRASLGQISGLTIGPDGDLYIAANTVVKLTTKGLVEWVAGNNATRPPCGSVYCNPAGQADLTNPRDLAFDHTGNMLVADGNGYGLFELLTDGHIQYLGQFRGDGAPGALASAPGGTIIESWRNGVDRLLADGSTRPVAADLNSVLGRVEGTTGRENLFIGGDGLAVAPNGTIYVDTNSGNAFTTVSALIKIDPNGRAQAIWKSEPSH